MDNKDMPAMPLGDGCVHHSNVNPAATGLNKREYFAGLAMQAILSKESYEEFEYAFMAQIALKMTDALLAELDKG